MNELMLERAKYILKKYPALRFLVHPVRCVIDPKFRADNSFLLLPDHWHYMVSYFLADNVYWFFKPVAEYLKNKKFLFFVNNISWAVGHVYPEVDWGYRMKWGGVIEDQFRLIYVYPKSPVLKGFADAQRDGSIVIIQNVFLHLLLYPLLIKYPYLSIDTGHSSYNHTIGVDQNGNKVYGRSLPYVEVFRLKQRSYVQLRSNTKGYFPLRTKAFMPAKLSDFLCGTSKYCVVQLKDVSVNGTYKPVDPLTYLLAIRYMKELGYTVVFAGREKMPDVFLCAGVLNYSQSDIATPLNDYYLVRSASAVLASASGFSYIPDTLGVPLLSVNQWQVNSYPGERTIQLLTLLSNKGRKMTFVEQMEYQYHRGQISSSGLPLDSGVDSIDATDEEILMAFKELLALVESGFRLPLTDLQLRFNKQFPDDPQFYVSSRVSHHFLTRNIDRFE